MNYPGFSQVKHFLILFDTSGGDIPDYVVSLSDTLKREEKSVDLFGFCNSRRPKEGALSYLYYKSDVNFFLKPSSRIYPKELTDSEVLIDWTKGRMTPNFHLVQKSQAGLKIGLNRNIRPYHLKVSCINGSEEQCNSEIFKYLKIINHD